LGQNILDKIALFCNVEKDAVIENLTLSSLYECPVFLHEKGLDNVVCRVLGLNLPMPDMSQWNEFLTNGKNRTGNVTIALVGKYVELEDAYLSVIESFNHASFKEHVHVNIKWVDSEQITHDNVSTFFEDVDGVIVPGGFGNRGIEGMIETARFCRETGLPYFGICLGMQIATIEFARNVLGYKGANSAEFDANSKHKVIDLMEEQKNVETKGGTMRLGSYPCRIKAGTIMSSCYEKEVIEERHRHRYEYNSAFREELESKGLMVTGQLDGGSIVETVEIPTHPFFIGVQFHPEFKSRPNRPQPIFVALVKAAKKRKGL
ncbi:MAG: CTP synthase, partial [Bacilli bacterium]|nr:CTP synthase [Bacilli bacterium]